MAPQGHPTKRPLDANSLQGRLKRPKRPVIYYYTNKLTRGNFLSSGIIMVMTVFSYRPLLW